MPRRGLRTLSLSAADPATVREMIAEGETLFVEQKSGIAAGDGHQIAKAAASLANALGGWILVGVANSKMVPWTQPPGEFVDAVRQRLEGKIDPMPAFAAAIVDVGDEGAVGVIRVFESDDTPHLVGGVVYVREPGKDRKTSSQPPYEPTAVRSHYELGQLVARGERARAAARSRLGLDGSMASLKMDELLGRANMTGWLIEDEDSPAVVLRLTPLTVSGQWQQWPASPTGTKAVRALVERLAPPATGDAAALWPLQHGCWAESHAGDRPELTPGGSRRVRERAVAAVVPSGYVGVSRLLSFDIEGGNAHDWRPLKKGREVRDLIIPVLQGLVVTLESAELLGRYLATIDLLGLKGWLRISPQTPGLDEPIPAAFSDSAEITIDGASTAGETYDVDRVVDGWARAFARTCGLDTWSEPVN